MIKSNETFPILITAKKFNVPKNYVVISKLKSGEVIAVSEFAVDLLKDDEPIEENKVA